MRAAKAGALVVLVLTLAIINFYALSVLEYVYSRGFSPYPPPEYYEARQDTFTLIPLALLANVALIPLTITLLPDLKSSRIWMVASVISAFLAAAMCWPSIMGPSMEPGGFMIINGMVVVLPELEIVIIGCIAASVALLLKSRDWSLKLSLIELVVIGMLGAGVTVYVSIHSRIWLDLPWMGSGSAFIAHTFILFVGAGTLGWHIASGRRIPSVGVMMKRYDIDQRILLLIFTIVSFGLTASVFGYGILTPQYHDNIDEVSHSVLLNALPGTLLLALLFVSLRSIVSKKSGRMEVIASVVYLVMLAAIYYTIMRRLANMYGT